MCAEVQLVHKSENEVVSANSGRSSTSEYRTRLWRLSRSSRLRTRRTEAAEVACTNGEITEATEEDVVCADVGGDVEEVEVAAGREEEYTLCTDANDRVRCTMLGASCNTRHLGCGVTLPAIRTCMRSKDWRVTTSEAHLVAFKL